MLGLQLSKRELAARTLDVTGCGRLLRATSAWQGLLTLNYHRIGDPGQSPFDRNLWSASEEDFDQQVSLLAKGFDVIGVGDLDEVLRRRRGRYVLITFDDGYRDNYSAAFPILKSHNVPATFFIATGFIDRPRAPWWDELAWMIRTTEKKSLEPNSWLTSPIEFDEPNRERAFGKLLAIYKGLGPEATDDYLEDLGDLLGTGRCPTASVGDMWMTWDMIRELRDAGMSIGGHTVNHPILANLPSDQQDWEIGECRRRLSAELRRPITAFSYPNGTRSSFNDFTRAALKQFGFSHAFTFHGGYARPGADDSFALPRTAIETDVTLPMFRAKLTLPQMFA